MREGLEGKSTEERRELFETVADDDMPDGAYFALAEEFGLSPEDLNEGDGGEAHAQDDSEAEAEWDEDDWDDEYEEEDEDDDGDDQPWSEDDWDEQYGTK